MKKYIIIISVFVFAVAAFFFIPKLSKSKKLVFRSENFRMMPKVLFLTTGGASGNGELASGVDIALQSFNRRGAFVWLNTREILLQPDLLSNYSIMLIPTSIGYHDGDKKYSLTYLSDQEMQNIKDWVNAGGTLIAEENIGRNKIEEIDRVGEAKELNPDNWKLSDLFGIKMIERDLAGFSIEEKDVKIWNGRIKQPATENEWALVPGEIISDKVKVYGEWTNGEEKIPAIIRNDFGEGKAYLLTSTYLLHPSNDGGVSSIDQIERFYDFVLSGNLDQKKFYHEINPWPNGFTGAFCVTFNPGGDSLNYLTLLRFLEHEKIPATFFVDSSVSADRLQLLSESKHLSLESDLYSTEDFSSAGFSAITHQILLNEEVFKRKFRGLRFPFNNTNFWGLLFADERDYIYDSSIGVDHLTSYSGSVFPYNVPVAKNEYYKTLNILELCPVKNSDNFYYQKAESQQEYADEQQRSDAQLFEKYMLDFFNFVMQKNNGLMIYSGSPKYSAFSEITLQPLKKITDTAKAKNCWVTELKQVTDFRNLLKVLSVHSSEDDHGVMLKINLPDHVSVKGLTFKFKDKPSRVKSSGSNSIKEYLGSFYVVADVENGDVISVEF